jgi:hypothetical protein
MAIRHFAYKLYGVDICVLEIDILLEFVYEAEGSVAVNDPEEYQVQFDVSLEELICISIGAANL